MWKIKSQSRKESAIYSVRDLCWGLGETALSESVYGDCGNNCSIATALWLYPSMEKASGVNLEAKSEAGVPEAVRDVLATPATSLEPVVLALAFPLDYFTDVERGDLLLGNSLSSILFYPRFMLSRSSIQSTLP